MTKPPPPSPEQLRQAILDTLDANLDALAESNRLRLEWIASDRDPSSDLATACALANERERITRRAREAALLIYSERHISAAVTALSTEP